MTQLIRSACLTGFAELARTYGLNPSLLLSRAALPPKCLSDPDLKIPAARVRDLLEAAAAQSGEVCFGLCLAKTRQISNLGLLALVMREETTLRAALDVVVRLGRFHNEALFLSIDQRDQIVTIRQDVIGGIAHSRQATELAIGVTFRLLRFFLGLSWQPHQVCFTHSAPTDLGLHRRFFGQHSCRFSCPFNGIVCNAADLDAPNPGADPVLARYARQWLNSASAPPEQPLAHEVRQLVSLLLPMGQCGIKRVAQHLGVDRRTIHRRLEHEGETFTAIVRRVRLDLVPRYLEDGQRPLSEVAGLLGFSSPSAFSTWYRRHFRSSPSSGRAS